jgi:hypothetical protein
MKAYIKAFKTITQNQVNWESWKLWGAHLATTVPLVTGILSHVVLWFDKD